MQNCKVITHQKCCLASEKEKIYDELIHAKIVLFLIVYMIHKILFALTKEKLIFCMWKSNINFLCAR